MGEQTEQDFREIERERDLPPDELPGDEQGVCMNCGAEMDFSPMHPWCPDCSGDEAA